MKRDYDFVTMDDYKKDTAELTQQASGIIAQLKQEMIQRDRVIRALIKVAGGRVAVPLTYMHETTGMLSAENDLANDVRVFKLRD